jgi:hypothetical protein
MFSIDMTNCTRKLYGGVIGQLPRHIQNNRKKQLKMTRQNVVLNQFTPKRPNLKPMVANVRQINHSPSYSMVQHNQSIVRRPNLKPMVANVRQINHSPSYSMLQDNQSIVRRPNLKPMVANMRQINHSPGYSFVYTKDAAGGKYRKNRKYYTRRKRRN